MDKERAKEIASSPVMIDVTYDQTQIYIESVDENKDTACIHPLKKPAIKKEVSLQDLIEN
ncbi:H-type small acid-soluble spore protein [Clostridium sp. SHJSY1]|uniref:H-type small acid-soluble spore protein n=1 Tax=Clostridium sp. SHJSY1 TaxID=2942483 RepID=UPI0028750A2A|nr:H-type small acid-soluble spore protein [Clostridium sp. SHJSY1]MDS0526135.1 H-type small acid-soluble spore protein [Clostridium sp. SHJSY1]